MLTGNGKRIEGCAGGGVRDRRVHSIAIADFYGVGAGVCPAVNTRRTVLMNHRH